MYVCINTTLVHLILFGWGLTLIEFEWGGRERKGWGGGGLIRDWALIRGWVLIGIRYSIQ